MAKNKNLCESRGLAKAIGWPHRDVLNYLDEECIPYKAAKSGAIFPANMIERDMWAAYKASRTTLRGGRGKKSPRKFRGTKKRSLARSKRRAFRHRFSRAKKRYIRAGAAARRATAYAKKRHYKGASKITHSKKHAANRSKARRKGAYAKKGTSKKRKARGLGFNIKRIFWFWQ